MENEEVVVITGASAGVGRAIVRRFARDGASIGLLARGKDRLEAAKKEVERAGGRAIALPTDVSDPDQVETAAEKVERAFGPIDIWINDAMVTVYSAFLDMTPEEFKRATEVSYLGFVYGTRSALKRMVPRNRGTVVQVGSALAYRSVPLQSVYCGAKSAIRGFTDSVRTELIHNKSRVHISMVQLPAVNTIQFNWGRAHLEKEPRPLAPVYQPEVVAEAIHWAAHHRRREIHLGISSAGIIAANKLAPGLLDRYLGRSAYGGQQRNSPISTDRPDNLFEPPPGDPGAHGDFDNESYGMSPQFKTTKNRFWVTLAAVGAFSAGALWVNRKSLT